MLFAHRLAWVTSVALLILSSTSVEAQGWMSDRSRREGPGFRIGNLELHPGLGIEGGYDTNVFYEDQDPQSSFLLRLTAHVDVATLGPQRRAEGETREGEEPAQRNIDFRAGAAASYYHFFIDQARDNVAADAYLAATINPQGRFSFYVHDEFSRTIRPFIDRAPDTDGEVPTYARNRNVAGAELRLQSAGGVLKGSLGYDYTLDHFQDDIFAYVNSHQHEMRLQMSWRFLPETALISVTQATRQNYYNDDGSVPAASLLDDHWRIGSKIGLNGAVTRTLAFTALVGYAGGFYDVADDFDNVEVMAGLKWRPRETISAGIGYDRRFQPSFIGNFQRRDRIYLNGQMLLGGAFLLGADLALAFAETGLALTDDGELLGNSDTRKDIYFTATLYSEYRFTDWLGVPASIGYYGDFTDYEYTFDTGGAAIPDPGGGYQKFEAWLGLRAFY